MKKKNTVILIGLVVSMLLSGCGSNTADSSMPITASENNVADSSKRNVTENFAESGYSDDGGITRNSESYEEGDVENDSNADNESLFSVKDVDGGCSITGVEGAAKGGGKGRLVVPETIGGEKVVSIGSTAFGDVGYESITLPDSVEKIDDFAFTSCSNLKEINLGSGLKEIGIQAFVYCPALETLTFPEGMETIDGFLFGGNDSLSEVYIPSSVTNISALAVAETCPNIVIVTPAGSAAENVAKEEGLTVRNR